MIRDTIKRVVIKLDKLFAIDLRNKCIHLEKSYYGSTLLNLIRRRVEPFICKLWYKYNQRTLLNSELKLHLGCGERELKGYINIDLRKTRATDLVCDIRKLPYPDNSVKVIETYHVIEHLPRNDLPRALKEWYRILMPEGKLIIECPDFDANVLEYLRGNNPAMQLHYIYGRQRFPGDVHYFGYNFDRLARLVKEAGFTRVKKKEPQDYHKAEAPCLRVEARK